MKSSFVFTAEGRLNTKAKRQKDCANSRSQTIEPSYKNNSTKEELCLEYIHSFNTQFEKAYKNRKPPYITAKNEYGITKCVCTTLRPTLIPIPELYDMYECASFLAGYILYEPLDPQTEHPSHLFSPTQTLNSHTGDSYDFSVLLCSFLIGSGYDAYVMCGYAPRFITLKDQSMTKCPIPIDFENVKKSKSTEEIRKSDATISSTYIPPDNTVKSSKYLADVEEAKRLAALDTFKLWIPDDDLDEKKMMDQEKEADIKSKTKRNHAWVYVAPGKKEVKEGVFIESSTGRIYTIPNSPYMGIESVWNASNFWVNLVPDSAVNQLDYTFSKTQFWEKLFYDAHTKSAETKDAGGDQDFMGSNDEDGDPESDEIEGQEFKYFDAPPTWVSPLALHRTKYTLRYPPSGKRSIQYYCSKADFFAKRKNSQSMVMRISTYLDKACTILKEVHEWYDNRQDKMYKRARYFLGNRRFVEFYHPGSFGEVKKWTEYPGKSIEVDFYVNGRLDRLARREEIIGKSVVEYFHDRTDFLVYRSVDLCPASPNANGTRQFVLPGGSLSSELHITKMVQEFDRDPADTNGSSIAKRVFNVREGKGVFYHHFGKGQITGKVKTYFHTKGPTVPTISEQALAQEVGVDDDPDALLEASALERECYTSVKASFQQSDKVTDFRKDVERELEIPIEQTVFEIALENVDRGMSFQGSNMDKFTSQESKGSDYLTPFLRNVRDPTSLTREEALEVRQTCLDALKARLVERANIIQTRLHDENAKLGKKQEQFQRSQREGDLSTEEYEKYCTEAMFRIQILEQRLASHEEAALRKFADLDIKLSSDPRLKVLRN